MRPERRKHRATKPEPDGPDTDVDVGFIERAYFPPLPTARWGPILPSTTFLFGPVRVLDAAGNEVRLVSVEELAARPRQVWEPKESGHVRANPITPERRKRKYVVNKYWRGDAPRSHQKAPSGPQDET